MNWGVGHSDARTIGSNGDCAPYLMHDDLPKTHLLHWGVQLQAQPQPVTGGESPSSQQSGRSQRTSVIWRELQPRPRAPPGQPYSQHILHSQASFLGTLGGGTFSLSTLRLLLCPSHGTWVMKRPSPLGRGLTPLCGQRPLAPAQRLSLRRTRQRGADVSSCLLLALSHQ